MTSFFRLPDLPGKQRNLVNWNISIISSKLFFCAFLLTLMQTNLIAASLNGGISYGYTQGEDTITNIRTEPETTSTSRYSNLMQSYSLNYSSFFYNPKLLTYSLGGNINYTDNRREMDGSKGSSETDSYGYNASLSFFQSSFMPFRLRMLNRDSPFSSTDGNNSIEIENHSELYGLNGSIRFPSVNINYELQTNEMETQSEGTQTNEKNTIYTLTLQKKIHKNDLLAIYRYDRNEYATHDALLNGTSNAWTNEYEDLTLSYTMKLSDILRFSSYASYTNSITYNYQSYHANFSLNWTPVKAFSSSFNMATGRYLSSTSIGQSNTMSGSSSYKISKELSFFQNFTFLHDINELRDSNLTTTVKSATLGAGLAYTTVFGDSYNFSSSASGSSSTSHSENDLNSSTTDDKVSNFSIGSQLSKNFDFLDSSLRLSASYGGTTSSQGQENTNFSSALTWSATLPLEIIYSTSLNYTQSKNLYKDESNISKNEVVSYSYSYSNGLSKTQPVFGRGTLKANCGQSHATSFVDGERASIQDTFSAALRFNYIIFRGLSTRSFAMYQRSLYTNYLQTQEDRDYTIQNTLDIKAHAGLLFALGKFRFSTDADYGIRENYSSKGKYFTFRAQLSRSF